MAEQFNLLERKIGYNSRTPMDSPKLRKTMVKEKSTFLSPELKSLVNDAFKKLVAISCERAALTDAHEVYAHELYCPRHGINHPLRPQDRKEIWKEIKNELLKMETAPAIFNFDIRGANILYSKLIERNTHHSPSVESPKPTPPKNISVVLTEEEAKEFWECYRKNAFLNREIALSAVDCAPFPQEGVRPYQCPWCNNWHIGHASWLTNGEASEYYYRNRLSKANRKDLQSLDKYKLFILKRRSQEALKS